MSRRDIMYSDWLMIKSVLAQLLALGVFQLKTADRSVAYIASPVL